MDISTTHNPTSATRSLLDRSGPLQPDGPTTGLSKSSDTASSKPDSMEDTVSIGAGEKSGDSLTYSPRGLLNGEEKTTKIPGQESDAPETEEENPAGKTEDDPERKTNTRQYTREEQEKIENLKDRDREVRAHEQAHIAAGGQYVRGGAQFQYQTGPDGGKYAVGGEVSIDVARESGDPEATVTKMQVVIRAALAPAEPSGQDRAVAAQAVRTASEARMEAAAEAGSVNGQTSEKETSEDSSLKTTEESPVTRTMHIDRYA